jgi:hypothetical protein
VDRVSGAVASFGLDHRLRYGAVRPCFVGGKKCLMMEKSLENENPAAFDFVKSFVRTNGLRMSEWNAANEFGTTQEHAQTFGAVA